MQPLHQHEDLLGTLILQQSKVDQACFENRSKSPSASLISVDFSATDSSHLRFFATHFYSLNRGFLSLTTITTRHP